MKSLLVVALLLAFLFDTAAAASPVVDPSLSVAPMEPFYSDPEGILDAVCELCEMSICICMHNTMRHLPQRADSFTAATFYDHPDWPQQTFEDLDEPEFEPMPLPTYYTEDYSKQLRDDIVQQFNSNATTIQPSTVQIHVEGTYNPGDRTQVVSRVGPRRPSHRRQAPRPGGFPCPVEGCGKAFDRSCDLKRHQKTHLCRNERPHKCSVCNEGFLYPKDRTRHQRTHDQSQSSQAVLHCLVPGCVNVVGFSRRDNLLRHQRKQHPIISVSA